MLIIVKMIFVRLYILMLLTKRRTKGEVVPGDVGDLWVVGGRNWARRLTFRYFGQYFGRHLDLGRGFGAPGSIWPHRT